MNDYQRQASFDRAQASYDNMSPDEGPEPPEGDCPTCGEPSENFDSERDEEGTHVWMKDCESCVNLSNFTGNEKEAIHEWRQEWLNAHPDTQNPDTKRWTRHADTRAEINKICDLALEALSPPAPLSSEAVGQLKEIARQARIVYRETSAEGYIQNTTGATELDVLDEMLKEYEALLTPSPSEKP